MSAPNILIFITDQHRADHLGCYGNPALRTPHIDALASAGVRAERFYAASTTCMSNRATLMTGRLPSVHGVVHNGINLSLDQTTFVELLRDAGYATALIGKSHLQCFGYDHPDKRAWLPAEGRRPPAEGLRDATKRPRMGKAMATNGRRTGRPGAGGAWIRPTTASITSSYARCTAIRCRATTPAGWPNAIRIPTACAGGTRRCRPRGTGAAGLAHEHAGVALSVVLHRRTGLRLAGLLAAKAGRRRRSS